MAAVVAERLGEAVVFVGEGGVVIHIRDAVGYSIGMQALVDVDNGLCGAFDVGIPHEGGAGWNCSKFLNMQIF